MDKSTLVTSTPPCKIDTTSVAELLSTIKPQTLLYGGDDKADSNLSIGPSIRVVRLHNDKHLLEMHYGLNDFSSNVIHFGTDRNKIKYPSYCTESIDINLFADGWSLSQLTLDAQKIIKFCMNVVSRNKYC